MIRARLARGVRRVRRIRSALVEWRIFFAEAAEDFVSRDVVKADVFRRFSVFDPCVARGFEQSKCSDEIRFDERSRTLD